MKERAEIVAVGFAGDVAVAVEIERAVRRVGRVVILAAIREEQAQLRRRRSPCDAARPLDVLAALDVRALAIAIPSARSIGDSATMSTKYFRADPLSIVMVVGSPVSSSTAPTPTTLSCASYATRNGTNVLSGTDVMFGSMRTVKPSAVPTSLNAPAVARWR